MRKKWFSTIIITFMLFYTLPVHAEKNAPRTWENETVYYLVVDRFNNSDFTNDFAVDIEDPNAYHGGDFQGIMDRLAYIKDMGFTTIMLSPIFQEESRKGVITQFYEVEEHYGSLKKFKQLVNKAHQQGLKVMLDLPVPDETLEAQKVANWWITETGIDGYRLMLRDISNETVQALSEERTKANIYVIGDTYGLETVSSELVENLDAITNYELTTKLREAFAKPNQAISNANQIVERNHSNQQGPAISTFMDNELLIRFTRDSVNINEHPGPRWKLALTYLYTIPGTPVVYYGSEIALDGGETPDNQRQMDFRTDKELIEYMTQIGATRQSLPSLTKGNITFLYEKEGMTVFKREYQGETTVVAINNTSKTQTAKIESGLDTSKELRGMLSDEIIRPNQDTFTIVLDRELAQVYHMVPKTGINILYLTVMGAVYAAFFVFIYLIWKRSRQKRTSGNK